MSGPEASPSIDLPSWLRAVVDLDHDAELLQFEGSWRTWGWLATAISDFDQTLDSAGLTGELRVGVLMRNRPEVVRAVVATLAARRCLVTLSSAIPAAKLAEEITRIELPVIVAGEHDWEKPEFESAVRAAGSLGLAVGDGECTCRVVVGPGDRASDGVDTAPGVAVEMLTSGTTGPPKRIDLPYRSLEYEIESTAQYSTSGELAAPRLGTGTSLVWNPILHIGGLRGLISSLVSGRKIALLERFTVDAWAELVREHRPRAISLAPTALSMVLEADVPKDTFEGVKAAFSGAAPLDPELGRQFEERYGVPVLVVYGATEFAGGVAGWTLDDWRRFGDVKVGSVGRPNVGVTVRVVDEESDVELPRGELGVLEVKAPQLSTPGWTRTTDLARMDDDDFIWIVGRADDVIVRGGFKVRPETVRDALVSHPSVFDACVFGVADRRLGQVPVAAVELRPNVHPVAPDELTAFARERLSGYQMPVDIRIFDELPRTPSMKVSQAELRPLFESHTEPSPT